MRRDCVTQIIVDWGNGEWENFATPFEAEQYINAHARRARRPQSRLARGHAGNKKWDYEIVEDDNGLIRLVD